MSKWIRPVSIGVALLAIGAGVVLRRTTFGGASRAAGLSTAPQASGATNAHLLLNELGFLPLSGEAQWLELVNAGATPVRSDGVALENQAGERFALANGITIAPGAVLLVRFDGQPGSDATTVHAPATAFLAPAGFVRLVDATGRLDRISWGDSQPDGANLGRGGFDDRPQPGMSLGRIPQTTASDPFEWLPYSPPQTTAGRPNVRPAVEILMPMDGAIVSTANAFLTWYTVPHTARYRVQVASDSSFRTLVFDQSIEAPPVAAPNLAPGKYVWHVQAIGPDGTSAEQSPPSTLTVRAERSAMHHVPTLLDWLMPPAQAQLRQPSIDDQLPIALDVPLIQQHKDTRMLLLEAPESMAGGGHRWDADHGGLSTVDPADNMNCAAASVAMLTEFYGGHLSQDRINYEVFQAESPGPERDLNWGRGYNRERLTKAMAFAFGVPPRVDPAMDDLTTGALWTARIEAGIPGIACKNRHCVAVTGFGSGLLILNDPALRGTYLAPVALLRDATVFTMTRPPTDPTDPSAYPMLVRPKSDEPEIARDSDGDGVVDFDEVMRFHTRPDSKDTDHDDLPDKDDIKASVHDRRHGYAYGGDGRDFDRDGTPMELDPDSDGGGCLDGWEDVNKNGSFEAGMRETDNFDKKDDACVNGSQVFVEDTIFTEPDGGTQKLDHRTTIQFFTREVAGVYKGRAIVTASFRQELHDPPRPGVACPDSVDNSQPYRYAVEVQVNVAKMTDRTAAVSVTTPPDWTPPVMRFVSTCRGRPPFEGPGIAIAVGGVVRDGIFREHVDLPLDRENGRGQKYYDTEIRQGEGAR